MHYGCISDTVLTVCLCTEYVVWRCSIESGVSRAKQRIGDLRDDDKATNLHLFSYQPTKLKRTLPPLQGGKERQPQ